MLISTFSNGDVVLWKPGTLQDESVNLNSKNITKIFFLKPDQFSRYCIEKEHIWFMRMDPAKNYLELVNDDGTTEMWDFKNKSIEIVQNCFKSHQKCNKTIRMTSFSPDGSILVCGCKNGTIFKFNRKNV